jgi:hypothetical protein
MAWTWERVEREWLVEGRIAVSPTDAVDSFNRVESLLGSDWLLSCRGNPPVACGPAPTLCVVNMGRRLAVLEGVRGTEKLLNKIRQGDHSASAELTAIYLLKSGSKDIDVELEPTVEVAGRTKRPDFRISLAGGESTFVEVTQPNLSEEQERAHRILERITAEVKRIQEPFALEVFLRRGPTEREVEQIRARLPDFCNHRGVRRESLGDLGFLVLNLDVPGQVAIRSHEGEESRPRICQAQAVTGPNEPLRHLVVRLAFSDERARQFLEAEARQLPREAPGLIMMQMSRAPGGFTTWAPLLERRLQPNLHTRVSAVSLFTSGLAGTDEGEAWVPHTKLLINRNAKLSLPEWIVDQLGRFASG